MSVETVRKYLDTLSLLQRDKEEVENVMLGYMADCEAKDKRIDKLEAALEDLLNDCINFGNENMTTRILKQAAEVLES